MAALVNLALSDTGGELMPFFTIYPIKAKSNWSPEVAEQILLNLLHPLLSHER